MRPFEDEYRATTYRVYAPGGAIDLHIGQRSAALDALLHRQRVREWAFVTAWNPASRPLPQHENDARHVELVRRVESARWAYYTGAGVPQRSDWTAETSLLVIGIPRDEAIALARAFGQNAIVAGVKGGEAELVYV